MNSFTPALQPNLSLVLAVLQSIARTVLVREKSVALPLAGIKNADFATREWSELGFDHFLRMSTGAELAKTFGNVNIPANVFEQCTTPLLTAGAVTEKWLAAGSDIYFFSSGSTGTPKSTMHSWAMLMQELEAVNALLNPFKRVLAFTPLQHCYGFMFSVLLPALRGVSVEYSPPLPTVARNIITASDLVVGFPDFWRNMPHSSYQPPANVQCLSATAPWAEPEHLALKTAGFSATLEIYGSSENGVMGWRKHPANTFELLPYFCRYTHKNGQDDDFMRTMPNGTEQLTPIQDVLEWEDERHFRPVGRKDNAVQVSGINVYPGKVAATIAAMPGVSECRVRLMHPNEGWRLKVFIVPAAGVNPAKLRPALKEKFRQELSAPERPASITFGNTLPKTAFGKDADW